MSVRVPILMYHKVAPVNRKSILRGHYVSPGLFNRQLALVSALGYKSVSLSAIFDEPLPKRPIVLTFDDGYQNFHSRALPIMKRKGMNGVVFLVSRQIGGRNQWDISRGDVEEKLLSLDEIKDCQDAGIEFGSHTQDHVNLATVDPDVAWKQISESREELEEILKAPVSTFCYPYGGKTPQVKEMVQRAGYRLACSTLKGSNTAQTDRFALRRINVRGNTSMPTLALKMFRSLRHAD